MIVNASVTVAVNTVSASQSATPPATTENPSALMPEVASLQCSGDPGAMLAALTMMTAKNERETASKQRDAAMSAQEKSEAAEIQDLHDKATLQRWQGAVDGALQIGEGVCDVGKGIDEAKQVTDTGADLKNDKVDAAWLGGGSTFCKAAQSISHGLFQGAITDKEADEKIHEASADSYKKMAEDAHDDEKDAKDLMSKALDFYKEYTDTKNQTAMAAIHRA
jgi:hypothetical protein